MTGEPELRQLTHGVYADARGEQLDLLAAFKDAIAFDGGPLRCAV